MEILLDTTEADPNQQEMIQRKFLEWYQDGSEIRHNKISFGSMSQLKGENRYLVDIGYVDLITAFKNLHARLHRLGVKVFIHFLP